MWFYGMLALMVLIAHLAWIIWVIAGCWFARSGWLARLHVISLAYSIFIEASGWYCPLTYVEQWAQLRAGKSAYTGDFLVHYLEKLIYPAVPYPLVVVTAISICVLNLSVHFRRWRHSVSNRRSNSVAASA